MNKNEEVVETLRWFVEFANINLDSIKRGDKAKLLIEAEEHFYPDKEIEEFQAEIPKGSPLFEKSGELSWALSRPERESEEFWKIIKDIQKEVLKLFAYLNVQVTSSSGQSKKEVSRKPGKVILGDITFLMLVASGSEVPYKIRFLPVAENEADYVQFIILNLLKDFSDHAIRCCPGCKKYFFNPTRKFKRFCGSKCMWRVMTAERRKNQPEAYKKYQKDLMEDRRREKAGLRRKHTKARIKPKRKTT